MDAGCGRRYRSIPLNICSTSFARREPDLLHFSQYCYGSLDVDMPKIVVAHSDVVSWWQAVHGEEPPDSDWTRWYRETVQKRLGRARRGGCALALDAVADRRAITARASNAAVIYNGRTPALFNPHGDKRRSCGLSVGRLWDEAKQVSLLDASAICALAGDHRRCDASIPTSVYRGDGDAHRLRKARLELKGDKLSEAGAVAVWPRCHLRCDVAVRAFRPCATGGRAVALCDGGQRYSELPRDVGRDGVAISATNDADGLRDAAGRSCASDPVLRRHYAELAYQRARRPYTADRMVDEYLDTVRALVPDEEWRREQAHPIPHFAHSWISDWNHGNAHFLRGLARELRAWGTRFAATRRSASWSLTNLVQEGESAQQAIEQFRREFPDLDVRFYQRDASLRRFLAARTAGRRHRDRSRME